MSDVLAFIGEEASGSRFEVPPGDEVKCQVSNIGKSSQQRYHVVEPYVIGSALFVQSEWLILKREVLDHSIDEETFHISKEVLLGEKLFAFLKVQSRTRMEFFVYDFTTVVKNRSGRQHEGLCRGPIFLVLIEEPVNYITEDFLRKYW